MKQLFLFSLLVFVANLLPAQTGIITGKVIEAESGFEVIGGT
ncbi:MAG: hypothetical protein ACI8VT_002105, partial [Saprospiraceae bacterium]